MNLASLLFASILLAFISGILVTETAYAQTSIISINKNMFDPGDDVVISFNGLTQDSLVSLEIIDPQGNPFLYITTSLSSYQFRVPINPIVGEYQVFVSVLSGNVVTLDTSTFTVEEAICFSVISNIPIEVSGYSVEIISGSSGVNHLSSYLSENKLNITIDNYCDPSVSVRVPKSLFSSISDVQVNRLSSQYSVTEDGDYLSIMTGLEPGTFSIDIIGTRTAPESSSLLELSNITMLEGGTQVDSGSAAGLYSASFTATSSSQLANITFEAQLDGVTVASSSSSLSLNPGIPYSQELSFDIPDGDHAITIFARTESTALGSVSRSFYVGPPPVPVTISGITVTDSSGIPVTSIARGSSYTLNVALSSTSTQSITAYAFLSTSDGIPLALTSVTGNLNVGTNTISITGIVPSSAPLGSAFFDVAILDGIGGIGVPIAPPGLVSVSITDGTSTPPPTPPPTGTSGYEGSYDGTYESTYDSSYD